MHEVMAGYVVRGEVPGLVTLVSRRGEVHVDAIGLVGYVTTLFKLSAVLTIVWARVFLHEGQIRERLLGASVMVVGGVLVAT
jgi:uncharacterized membrane protein